MAKRKIPKLALDGLILTCEWFSTVTGKPATEILKRYLGLMDKYAEYFFSEPWPENYDYQEATTFTEADLSFLSTSKEEFKERFDTVLLKKNLHLNGFQGVIGMMWTQQSYDKQNVTQSKEEKCPNTETDCLT